MERHFNHEWDRYLYDLLGKISESNNGDNLEMAKYSENMTFITTFGPGFNHTKATDFKAKYKISEFSKINQKG